MRENFCELLENRFLWKKNFPELREPHLPLPLGIWSVTCWGRCKAKYTGHEWATASELHDGVHHLRLPCGQRCLESCYWTMSALRSRGRQHPRSLRCRSIITRGSRDVLVSELSGCDLCWGRGLGVRSLRIKLSWIGKETRNSWKFSPAKETR